jgi:hypothetical protein
LARAARLATAATVSVAIASASAPLATNTKGPSSMRYANPASQRCIAKYATGQAMTLASSTSTPNSVANNLTISGTLAPSILRMPISFVRRVVLYDARP